MQSTTNPTSARMERVSSLDDDDGSGDNEHEVDLTAC